MNCVRAWWAWLTEPYANDRDRNAHDGKRYTPTQTEDVIRSFAQKSSYLEQNIILNQ